MEAARLGCKIIHGPNVNNFNEIYSLLGKNKISIKINNLNRLVSELGIILKKNVSSEKLIYKLSVIELLIKKNLDSSINIITDFVLDQVSTN